VKGPSRRRRHWPILLEPNLRNQRCFGQIPQISTTQVWALERGKAGLLARLIVAENLAEQLGPPAVSFVRRQALFGDSLEVGRLAEE